MNNSSFFNFDDCTLSNDLWPNFINKIGIDRAKSAVRQALDLQCMQGNTSTLPVLILETCGSALVSSYAAKTFTGFNIEAEGMLLIYSNKLKAIQLLRDN